MACRYCSVNEATEVCAATGRECDMRPMPPLRELTLSEVLTLYPGSVNSALLRIMRDEVRKLSHFIAVTAQNDPRVAESVRAVLGDEYLEDPHAPRS